VVDTVKKQTDEDARAINIAEDETPTEGNEVTIMEQLLGNMGRFNPKQ